MSDNKSHEKRLAVLLYPTVQRRIAELAKTYTLNQSEVIEVMLDILGAKPIDQVEALMKAKREAKVATRTSKTALLKSLSKLSADKLAELTKLAESQ